jgi:hypothetical protein
LCIIYLRGIIGREWVKAIGRWIGGWF